MRRRTGTLAACVLLALSAACGGRTSEGPAPPPESTGAVSELGGSQIDSGDAFTIEEVIRGHAPGLQVTRDRNGDFSFRIRGMDSLQQEQEPLVVIDGITMAAGRVSQALAGLNPQDISGVEVLRDVASTSIYGIRGAGGVILVTTRAR